MSASIKIIQSKPTLSHLFFCERDGIFLNEPLAPIQERPGYISMGCDELIEASELKARKSELESVRPDLAEILWPAPDECLLDILIDPEHPFYVGGNIGWNPLSLTYTQTFTFDTLDNLKNSYLTDIANTSSDVVSEAKAIRTSLENTLQQKVFVDGNDITSTCDWLQDI